MAGRGVPGEERVLWRGAPDPVRLARRSLRTALVTLATTAVTIGISIVLFLGPGRIDIRASAPFLVVPALVGLIVWVAWLSLSVLRVRRRASATTYTLTERRLVVDGPDGRTDLRLANLPELRLSSDRDGYGAITFTRPIGSAPPELVRRLNRAVGGGGEGTTLIECVPDVQHVFRLMRSAQAEAGVEGVDGRPDAGPRVDAPVTRLGFVESAAGVPLWFSGVFLLAGLLVVAFAVVVGLDAGGLPVAGLGLAFALLGGGLARGRLRVVLTRRRLRAVGTRVTGRVLDIAATGIQAGGGGDGEGDEQWVVRYAFDRHGHTYAGETTPVPWSAAARYASGDPIELLVDDGEPPRSLVSGLEA